MNEADQLRRAKRWAEDIPNESASTSAALDAFDPEVRSRVVKAANLGATMNIYKALAALHQDEDFQSDLLRLPIQRVIDDTKKNPENYEKHIQNPEIARALEKIRRFHAVVKANGGTTVDLVQMAAGNAETAAARDQHKLAELDSAYTAQLLAACAAARASAAGSEAVKVAARDAYNAEYTAFKKQHRPASKIAPAAAPPVDSANAAADIAALANESSFSWVSFKREAKRQGMQMVLMLLVTLAIMFFTGSGPFSGGGQFSGNPFGGGSSPQAAGSHQAASPVAEAAVPAVHPEL